MAELPEIKKLVEQMENTLRGKTINDVILLQEKCANVLVSCLPKNIKEQRNERRDNVTESQR